MASLTYIAKRNLIAGHSVDNEYTVDFNATVIDQPYESHHIERQALAGNSETLNYYMNDVFIVRTDPIPPSEKALWNEIAKSIRGGAVVTFDAYGTSSSPDNPQVVKCRGIPSRARFQDSDYFTYDFRVVAEPGLE